MWQSICGNQYVARRGPSTRETSPPALISDQYVAINNRLIQYTAINVIKIKMKWTYKKTQTGRTGNDGTHRHRIDVNPDEKEHTYKMVTRAATARADSGLVSKISFTTNTSPKADKYIQPYIITEYLIKIWWHHTEILTIIFILNNVNSCSA